MPVYNSRYKHRRNRRLAKLFQRRRDRHLARAALHSMDLDRIWSPRMGLYYRHLC
jgi:hypothetical protein